MADAGPAWRAAETATAKMVNVRREVEEKRPRFVKNFKEHSFCKLNSDPARADGQQADYGNHDPEQHALQQRARAHFAQRRRRKAGADQEQRDDQHQLAGIAKEFVFNRSREEVCIRHGRKAEKQDEPRPLNTRFAVLDHGRSD